MWSMVSQQLTQIKPAAATPDQLWQRVEAACSAVPQEHIESLFGSMPSRLAAVISINGATLATDSGSNHTSQKFNHLILGQHVIYKINFVVLSLVFFGVALTQCSTSEKQRQVIVLGIVLSYGGLGHSTANTIGRKTETRFQTNSMCCRCQPK
ncbi:hypothetical protein TNCV_656641 [Trichonephila clavipes]|nr:hypothetical protein TNCV_656641 [Trichonephila clavipes]